MSKTKVFDDFCEDVLREIKDEENARIKRVHRKQRKVANGVPCDCSAAAKHYSATSHRYYMYCPVCGKTVWL